MSADLSRVRFDPLLDYSGVVLQQGRLLLDGDFNESSRSRPAAPGGDRRPHVVRARSGPCRLVVGASPDAGWLRAHRVRRRPHHRSGADVRRRDPRREPRRPAHGVRPPAGRGGPARSPRRTSTNRGGRTPTRSPTAAPTSSTSTCGSARSPTSRIPTSSRSPSASTRPHGLQTVWQVRLLPRPTRSATFDRDDDDIEGWAERDRAVVGPAHRPTVPTRGRGRPVLAAAHRWLPRAGEPDLPGRDPRRVVRPARRRSRGRGRTARSRTRGRDGLARRVLRLASLGRDDVLSIHDRRLGRDHRRQRRARRLDSVRSAWPRCPIPTTARHHLHRCVAR